MHPEPSGTQPPAAPPGTYAKGERSPVVWVHLCARCAGYAEITPDDYRGALSGHCDGCGDWRPREVHRFQARIDSVAGCGCTTQHQQVRGDVAAAAGHPSTEAAELLARARDLVAALDGHIERRAEDKAGPLIEAAAERGRQMVERGEESAKAEIGRLQDIAAERGKRLHEADRQRAETRKYGIRLAYAAGLPGFTGWPSLVADIENRLKEKTDGAN